MAMPGLPNWFSDAFIALPLPTIAAIRLGTGERVPI
jgi:hypothetical protein